MDVSYLIHSIYISRILKICLMLKSQWCAMVRFMQLAMICDANTFLIVFAAQVMDYADGGDLHQRIQRTRQAGKVFSEDRIVRRPQGDVSSLLQLCLNRQVMIWDVQIWSIWKQSRPILFFSVWSCLLGNVGEVKLLSSRILVVRGAYKTSGPS